MLDCWMALDVDYTVRLAERLRPYRLRWIEDFLLPDDGEGFAQVRQRLPWQTLATGEHWYLPQRFAQAANERAVDIWQPDPLWVGGVSACVRICHIAEGAGVGVIPHGGMNRELMGSIWLLPCWQLRGVSGPGVFRRRGCRWRRWFRCRGRRLLRTVFWFPVTRRDLESRWTGLCSPVYEGDQARTAFYGGGGCIGV